MLRGLRSAAAALALLLPGCVTVNNIQPGVVSQGGVAHTVQQGGSGQPQPVPVTLIVHVDDSFTAQERQLLEAAVVSINIQTHGLVTVRTISGIDSARFAVPTGHWRLLRILDTDSLTLRFDMRNAKGKPEPIVGICVRADHNLYIVPDRIRLERQFLSVSMHEILHAVGAEHRDDPPRPLQRNVMSPYVATDAPVTLSATDLAELRSALTPTQSLP